MRRPALAFATLLPLAALSAPPSAATAMTAGGDQRVADAQATLESANWSGYATTGQFAAVSGSWTVPSVAGTTSTSTGPSTGMIRRVATTAANRWTAPGRHTPPPPLRRRQPFPGPAPSPTPSPGPRPTSSGEGFSAGWIGLDGFNNTDLIQAGTEQDFYDGAAHYSAWWEVLPAAETAISEPVSPGDQITASIVEVSAGSWKITLSDETQGWTFTKTVAYSGPGTSAEWIVEAPDVNGATAPLADYSFPSSAATAGDFHTLDTSSTIGGTLRPAGITMSGQIDLVQNGRTVSVPSGPNPASDAFNISYGSTAPAAPSA